ncbi:hypothetical protein D3C78_1227550 [compost metagenome]
MWWLPTMPTSVATSGACNLGCQSRPPLRYARRPTWTWRLTPARSRASVSAYRACTSTPTPRPVRPRNLASVARPASASTPVPRSSTCGNRRARPWKQRALKWLKWTSHWSPTAKAIGPAHRPFTTAVSPARRSCMTSCGNCPAGASTTSCVPTTTPSSTAWPMSTACRSSPTIQAPCPTVRTIWLPAWTSTSTWPNAA